MTKIGQNYGVKFVLQIGVEQIESNGGPTSIYTFLIKRNYVICH
jgi:hypothetical protein